MGGSRTEVLLLLLVGIVLLLMVALIGLFLRMEQLQREVLAALARCARPRNPPDCPLGRKPLRSPFPTFPASRYLWTRWRGGRCCWSSPPPAVRPAGRCTRTCGPSLRSIRRWQW